MQKTSAVPPRRRKCAPDTVVKSAARALDVLEFIGAIDRDPTLTEIARELDIPQSSASMLLRSLVSLGYLNYNRRRRTYRPTARVALIGCRVERRLFGDSRLLRIVGEVHEMTGQLVFLAVRNGLQVRIVHALGEKPGGDLHRYAGAVRPLATTASGRLFLSTLPFTEARLLVRRLNAEEVAGGSAWKVEDCLDELARIRQRGFAVSLVPEADVGAIAMLVPSAEPEPRTAIIVGGSYAAIAGRHVRYAEAMSSALQRDAPTPFRWASAVAAE